MKKLILNFLIIFLVFPQAIFAIDASENDCNDEDATTWCVPLSDSNIDIDFNTYCGGACDKTYTWYIEGGTRAGNIEFLNFIGDAANIINITHDGVTRAIVNGGSTYGSIVLNHCQYVHLDGSGLGGETYGIKSANSGVSSDVRVRGESGHIKISYIEMAKGGILINDGAAMDNTYTWDTFEIFNNYIHDTWYSGMYLGQNDPSTLDAPYIKNVSVHDNLFEDIGAYAMNIKGVHSTSGVNYVYNNVVRRTGVMYGTNPGINANTERGGLHLGRTYGTAGAEVYNNWIEDTIAEGVYTAFWGHKVYNNIFFNCGGVDVIDDYAQSFMTYENADTVTVYDNLMVQGEGYGLYARGTAYVGGTTASRNIICDKGDGEIYPNGGRIVVSDPPDDNDYYADCASVLFDKFSDDGDPTNDAFGGMNLSPPNGATGVSVGVALSGTLFGSVSTVDIYYECGDATPDVLVVDDGEAISYDPPGDIPVDTTCYWQVIYTHGWGVETGDIYSFTTAGGPPITSSEMARIIIGQ